MSQYSGEMGTWWSDFTGSDRATWSGSALSSLGLPVPARDGIRGAVSRRALKHGIIVTPGRRERAKHEATAQWRRQITAAIREPSLKAGVITVGSGFGGTGKTDVAVTLAAIYAAARPADRIVLADSNDDMPHGYIRLGGAAVETLPQSQRPLSIRGFYQACNQGRIKVYADLRDAVAWLQGVAVIRGDTADECVGVDFGEKEYLTVLEFLQCMSNIVINDGGTGLFAKLQVGTLLHGDKYVFVTEASQLGFWSVDQVFSRYRNYEGEKERPLSEQERKHLVALMDEATVVVDKYVDRDPEQVNWYKSICERFEGTSVSVVATPWDHALANRVPLNLGAVTAATLDAKLEMAEAVLRGADRANRRRHGLPEPGTGEGSDVQVRLPQRKPPGLEPPPPTDPDIVIVRAEPGSGSTGFAGEDQAGPRRQGLEPPPPPDPNTIVSAEPGSESTSSAWDGQAGPGDPEGWPDGSEDWILPARPWPVETGPEPGEPKTT